ncbi:Myb-like DNA-binding domain protein, partial [Ostertagia ostertagi]
MKRHCLRVEWITQKRSSLELEDEGSMDIEELRRRYGYSLSGDDESAEAECDSSSEVGAVADGEGECETVDVEASESGDFFHLPYDELDEGDDSDDRDYAPPDPWRKDVRVDAGRYQAAVPESMNDEASLASSDNDNDLPTLPTPVPGGALWMPTDNLSEVDIDRFLGDVVELREAHGQTICDRFSLTRDDEDALCALYRHRYDTDKAKAAFPFSRVNQPFRTVRQGALEWDLSERDLFERGIAMYGKNFSVIQKRLLPYRRVGELVEYYYFWKKTDRYQMFRKHTVYAEPDMHCLGPPLFAHNQYAQHPYDGALPEVGGTRADNDGVLPDMAGSGVLPSAEADT